MKLIALTFLAALAGVASTTARADHPRVTIGFGYAPTYTAPAPVYCPPTTSYYSEPAPYYAPPAPVYYRESAPVRYVERDNRDDRREGRNGVNRYAPARRDDRADRGADRRGRDTADRGGNRWAR